ARQAHNLKAAGSNPAPATTFIINHSQSTSDRHEILAHQILTYVSTFERGPGDCARLHHAMAHWAASLVSPIRSERNVETNEEYHHA
ncbi:hypothetical protein, partial [Acetobacter cibinongensis]|uniref:hypothetical protein n=1 Tax=Acetobacter cibinongensis TaxID=146475 RepID=UPI00196AF13E